MKLGLGKIFIAFAGLAGTLIFLVWNTFWSSYLLSRVYLVLGNQEAAVTSLTRSCASSPKNFFESYQNLPFDLGLELTDPESLQNSDIHLQLLLAIGTCKHSGLQKQKTVAINRLLAYGKTLSNESEVIFIKFIEKLKEVSEDSSLPYSLAGDYYLDHKKFREAQKYFEQAIFKEPFEQNILNKLIGIYLPRRDYGRIVTLAQSHFKKLKPDYYLLSTIGKSYAEVSQPHAAIEYLEQAIAIKPSSHQDHYLIGKLAETLDDQKRIDHLRTAYLLDETNKDALLRWMEYQLDLKNDDQVLSFLEENNPSGAEFDSIYLEVLMAKNDFEGIQQFLKQRNLDSQKFPEIIMFEAKLEEKNQNFKKAYELYEQFNANEYALPSMKSEALEQMIVIQSKKNKHAEVIELLNQLIAINPSDVTLMHRLFNANLINRGPKKAIQVGLEGLELFPLDEVLLESVSEQLINNKLHFTNIDILSNYQFIFDNAELAGKLALSYYEIGDFETAYVTLQRSLAGGKSDLHLSANLISLSRSKPPRNDPLIFKDIDKRRQQEQDYLKSADDQPADFSKSSLPPPAGLSSRVNLRGIVVKKFVYSGFAELHLPSGQKVELIEPMTESQLAFFADDDDRANYFLARYEGDLHRIHSKYLEIKDYPVGDSIGSGIVTNLDSHFSTTSQISSVFEGGQLLDVLSGTLKGLERTVILDEENFMSMHSAPRASYKVRLNTRTYHHFDREKLQLQDQYEFLSNYLFEDIYAIPSENKLVTFGPDMGSVNLFTRSSSKANTYSEIHSTQLDKEILGQKYKANFEQILYKGNLILDCNNDGILDYLSIWQSTNRSEKGILHALMSQGSDSYQDFFLPTDLRHIDNFSEVKQISPIHFLKDIEKDGMIEFELSQPLVNSRLLSDFVPLKRYYHLQGRKIVEVSSRYPYKLKVQQLALRQSFKSMIRNADEDFRTQTWYSNYVKALQKLESLQNTR